MIKFLVNLALALMVFWLLIVFGGVGLFMLTNDLATQ